MAALKKGFSKADVLSELSGLFISTVVRQMLEDKNFEAIGIVFPFAVVFIDRVTGNDESAPMDTVRTTNTELANRLMKDWREEETSSKMLECLKANIGRLREMMKGTFGNHCKTGLYSLNFHLLDYVVEDLEMFGSLVVLNSSPFKRYNDHIKLAYAATSQRGCSGLRETVKVLGECQCVDEMVTEMEGKSGS